jgi:(p)ppGpp synthase/HD superfamily hydrolase
VAVFVLSKDANSMNPTARYARALAYAHEAHDGHHRKGTTIPYLSHLLAVSALVMEHGGDEDEAIAGLLHDAVEDRGGAKRLADIRQQFGDRVAGIVDGCTDTDQTPKPPWQERKEEHLGHVIDMTSVQLVFCCDKLHNARSIVADLRVSGAETWHKFKGGRDGTLWYYQTIAREFRGCKVPAPLIDELGRVVAMMVELA